MSSIPVTRSYPSAGTRRLIVHHGGLLAVEAVLLAALLGLSVLAKRHPAPFPGDVGLARDIQGWVRHPFHPALVWSVRAVALAIILLMPVSRVLEGQHWPSDTLGGLLYGSLCAVLAAHVYLWVRQRWPVLLARDER